MLQKPIVMFKQSIETPYGSVSASWTVAGLYACEFDRGGRFLEASSARDSNAAMADLSVKSDLIAQGQELERAFDRYFQSGEFTWELTTLDWTGVSEFHSAVLRECFQIPSGTTLTYGELAQRAGRPKAARAVGAAMARNRWPILIPCHRVVGASGNLTGYSGNGGVGTKRKLIALEQEQAVLELSAH